ncbi:MAG: hypothetical protein J6B22_07500 [Clostridia bacterium]|nr:hypothetical protein [Clostridia bacterium]
MKKFLSVILIAVIVIIGCFCIFDNKDQDSKKENTILTKIEENPSLYPLYNRISSQEKEVYLKLCTAAQNFEETITGIYKGASKSEIQNFINTLNSYLYREIAYEHPELFWYDPYNFEPSITVNGNNEYFLNIKPSYLFDKKQAEQMNTEFQEKIEEIVSIAKTKTNTYEQVLYVHNYIVDNCVYDYDAYNNGDYKSPSINAYGCLVNGKAICSGYSMAFNAIMKRLGYEIGVEFSTYDGFSIFAEGHVWNYCKLDGDYYYFDLTWDDIDPSNESMYNHFEYYHSYFAITKDELAKAHLTLAPQAPTPNCSGTKYNYFNYNNLNFNTYDFETVKPAILSQAGQKYIQLRFDSYRELLAAERDLLTEKKIFKIFPEAKSYQYYISESKLQLYIFLNDYYLN